MLPKDEIARLAKAVHLRIEGPELEEMTEHLSNIVDYLSILEEVDVSCVKPLHTPLEDSALTLREDESKPYPNLDTIQHNAPELIDGHVAVPKVLPAH
jgi:aspartyl/glutamyl-tRNA(Asn/Gln) amidotransferase C subunit